MKTLDFRNDVTERQSGFHVVLKTTENYRHRFVFVLCREKKAAGGTSLTPRRKDLHTCNPQRHPQCLPDMRAMPKQHELQSPQYFLGEVNSAMMK